MLLTHADLLKTHLESVEDLAGVTVHVDRKFNVRELAAEALGKRTAGAFLSISLAGWTPENPDSGEGDYWAELRYELALSTVPHILEELEMPTFDALLASVILAIHGWKPDGLDPAYCPQRWRVGAGSYVPDPDFLVYLFPAAIAEDLAHPATLPED